MARGALNYTNYLELTNVAAVFYVNIGLIGLMGFFLNVSGSEIFNTFTLFGIFVGGAMAYFLKWSSNV